MIKLGCYLGNGLIYFFIAKGKIMKLVLTIVGMDKVGIIAKVSNALANMNINIININQNIMQGFFNMVMIAEMNEDSCSLEEAKETLTKIGEEIGVEIRLQSEEIFTAMHRI